MWPYLWVSNFSGLPSDQGEGYLLHWLNALSWLNHQSKNLLEAVANCKKNGLKWCISSGWIMYVPKKEYAISIIAAHVPGKWYEVSFSCIHTGQRGSVRVFVFSLMGILVLKIMLLQYSFRSRFDWSFAHLMAAVVATTSIILSFKLPGKWPFKMESGSSFSA